MSNTPLPDTPSLAPGVVDDIPTLPLAPIRNIDVYVDEAISNRANCVVDAPPCRENRANGDVEPIPMLPVSLL